MKRLLTLIAASLFVASVRAEPEIKGSPAELSAYLTSMPKTVSLTGEAEVKVPADRALISLKVVTEDKALQQASRVNQELRARIVRSLTENGFPAERIKASKFSSTPKYGVFKEKAKSYRVENIIKITAHDEKEFQAVAGLVDGINEVRYESIEFEHSDKEGLKAKALAQAVDKAIEKKKIFEEKLGVKLSPQGVAETGSVSTREMARKRFAENSPSFTGVLSDPEFAVVTRALEQLPSTFSEMVYSAQVRVEYVLENK